MSLTDAEREKYSQLYREFDADNNGLQFPELARLLRKIGWTEDCYTDADLADKFLEADQDDSRVINEEELLALLNQKPREELNASNVRRTFKEIDKDGSGKVNVEEFRAALANGGCQATLDEIQAIIDEGDTSGDGMLDCNELLKACGF